MAIQCSVNTKQNTYHQVVKGQTSLKSVSAVRQCATLNMQIENQNPNYLIDDCDGWEHLRDFSIYDI